MIRATRTEQQDLLELQQVDTTIRQLEHKRANLPEQQQLDDTTATLRKVKSDLVASQSELDTKEREQTRLEGDIAHTESRRKSEDARMYSGAITSDRELDAVRGEISSLKRRKSDLEDELLAVMERVEELTEAIDTLTSREGELQAQVTELSAARDTAAVDIDSELGQGNTKRADVAAKLPEQIIEFYEGMRERKGGLAVAALEGRSCTGCRLELTAVELEELKESADSGLTRCAQCDRILVLP